MNTQSLFNHYGALNETGQDLSGEFNRILRQFVDKHKDERSLPELESVLVSTLTGLFAEERLFRGLVIRKEEKRNAKQNTLGQR